MTVPDLHLFGGPHLTCDGRRLEIPEGSKRVLAFVALARRPVGRRYAAGMLWPEHDEARAAGNLRSALWRLRNADIDVLDVLDVDKTTIGVRADVVVDARDLLAWAARLRADVPEAGDLQVPATWVEALDLLPGWYDDWVLAERERLRQTVLHALEALSTCLLVAGRSADAVDAALLAVCAEPLRESAQRCLVRAHVAEGNLTEARRSVELYRGLLARELGTEPSDALTRLLTTALTTRNAADLLRR